VTFLEKYLRSVLNELSSMEACRGLDKILGRGHFGASGSDTRRTRATDASTLLQNTATIPRTELPAPFARRSRSIARSQFRSQPQSTRPNMLDTSATAQEQRREQSLLWWRHSAAPARLGAARRSRSVPRPPSNKNCDSVQSHSKSAISRIVSPQHELPDPFGATYCALGSTTYLSVYRS
jgi:hypothetical protein